MTQCGIEVPDNARGTCWHHHHPVVVWDVAAGPFQGSLLY